MWHGARILTALAVVDTGATALNFAAAFLGPLGKLGSYADKGMNAVQIAARGLRYSPKGW